MSNYVASTSFIIQIWCYMMLNIYHVDWFNHTHILQQQKKVSNFIKISENINSWIFDFFHFLKAKSCKKKMRNFKEHLKATGY